MYVYGNPKTKKALKEMVADPNQEVRMFAPGLGAPAANGKEWVEGPWYPEPHRWYAEVTVENGRVVKVK